MSKQISGSPFLHSNDGLKVIGVKSGDGSEARLLVQYPQASVMPSAAEFGVGVAQVGGVLKVSDGNKYFSLADTVALISGDNSYVTAATNTALIQSSYNILKSLILTTPGDYYFNGTWAIPSDSYTNIGEGVNLKRVGMTQTYDALKAFTNKNWQSTVYPVSGAVQGAAVGTGSLGFVYDVDIPVSGGHAVNAVGDYILLKGDTTKLYNGVHKVIAFDATSVTIRMYYSSGGMPAAVASDFGLTIANADANITMDVRGFISGEHDHANPNSIIDQVGGLEAMLGIFNKVGNLDIRNFGGGNVTKYALLAGNIYHANFNNLRFKNRSDGLHLAPPFYDLKIDGVTGYTGDDAIGFTTIDFSVYLLPDVGNGDCDSLTVSNVAMDRCGSSVSIYPMGAYKVKNIKLAGIHPKSGATIGIAGVQDFTITGTITSGTNTITGCSGLPSNYPNIANFYVFNTNFPDGTYIKSYSGTTATLSANATGSAASGSIKISGLAGIEEGELQIDDISGDNVINGYINTYDVSVGSVVISNVKQPINPKLKDIITSATYTAGSRSVTVTSTTGMLLGMPVEAVGMPRNSFIEKVVDATTLTVTEAPFLSKTAEAMRVINPVSMKGSIWCNKQRSKVGRITFKDTYAFLDCTSSSNHRSLFKSLGADNSIGELVFDNVTTHGIGTTSTYSAAMVNGLSQLTVKNNSKIFGAGNLIDGAANACVVNIEDIQCRGVQFLIGQLQTGSEINIDRLDFGPNSNYSNAILYMYNAAATFTLRLGRIRNTSGRALLTTVAHTFNLTESDGTVSIDGTKVTPVAGAIFYNTNAAYGTGVGLYAMGSAATVKLA